MIDERERTGAFFSDARKRTKRGSVCAARAGDISAVGLLYKRKEELLYKGKKAAYRAGAFRTACRGLPVSHAPASRFAAPRELGVPLS